MHFGNASDPARIEDEFFDQVTVSVIAFGSAALAALAFGVVAAASLSSGAEQQTRLSVAVLVASALTALFGGTACGIIAALKACSVGHRTAAVAPIESPRHVKHPIPRPISIPAHHARMMPAVSCTAGHYAPPPAPPKPVSRPSLHSAKTEASRRSLDAQKTKIFTRPRNVEAATPGQQTDVVRGAPTQIEER